MVKGAQSIEYKTTVGKADHVNWKASDPVEPDGQGWVFIGSTASDDMLLWFWKRPIWVGGSPSAP